MRLDSSGRYPESLPIVVRGIFVFDLEDFRGVRGRPRFERMAPPSQLTATGQGYTDASAVLIDEAAGREMARRLGLLLIGVLGTPVRAKQRALRPKRWKR